MEYTSHCATVQNMRYGFLLLSLLTLAALDGKARAELAPMEQTIGTGTAVEGDIVSVNGTIVKLWGIDAPEDGQQCRAKSGKKYDCFTRSRDELAALVGTQQMTCHIRDKDSKGQKVGTCGVNGLDLGALMVRRGWALSYYNLSPHYAKLEGWAQAEKRGLWRGQVQAPWIWRSQNEKFNVR
jgi:endonuclease YncB( thermonuclease family)